jgi:hypothetical protein
MHHQKIRSRQLQSPRTQRRKRGELLTVAVLLHDFQFYDEHLGFSQGDAVDYFRTFVQSTLSKSILSEPNSNHPIVQLFDNNHLALTQT